MRVGHVGARHADHVDLARGHRMPRGRHVGDAGGMEGGQADLGLDAPGRSRCGADRMPCTGITSVSAGIGVDAAADDVDEVDQPAGRKRRAISTPSSPECRPAVLVAT
jgi:hypothetical protein